MPDPTQSSFPSWATPVISGIASLIVGIAIERFRNRTVILKFKRNYIPLATATQDDYWGNIQVTYNGTPANHLNLVTIDIKNDSKVDLENVKVDFWVGEDSLFLSHLANYVDNGNSILLEPEFFKGLKEMVDKSGEHVKESVANAKHVIPKGDVELVKYYERNKKFILPVFNRNNTARFQFLAENNQGKTPFISISILHKSCKLVPEEDVTRATKRKQNFTLLLWIVLQTLIVYVLFRNYSGNKYAIIWIGVLGIISLYIAYGIFHILKWLRNLVR